MKLISARAFYLTAFSVSALIRLPIEAREIHCDDPPLLEEPCADPYSRCDVRSVSFELEKFDVASFYYEETKCGKVSRFELYPTELFRVISYVNDKKPKLKQCAVCLRGEIIADVYSDGILNEEIMNQCNQEGDYVTFIDRMQVSFPIPVVPLLEKEMSAWAASHSPSDLLSKAIALIKIRPARILFQPHFLASESTPTHYLERITISNDHATIRLMAHSANPNVVSRLIAEPSASGADSFPFELRGAITERSVSLNEAYRLAKSQWAQGG